MSHFSRIKTRIVEKEYLLDALKDLGFEYEEGEQKIRGFGGNQTPVQIRVKARRFGHDIGLRQNGDTWEIVADWWGVVGMKQKEFSQQLFQRYAYHAAKAQLEAQGFNLVSEEVGQEGRIHMVLRRTA